MMMVSRRLQERRSTTARPVPNWSNEARTELYRGQCNCSYWHGAFGGIYLPHLRNAVYQHADRRRQPAGPASPIGRETWVEADGRRFQLRRPAGSAPGQRQADGPGGAQPRRPDVRARRPPRSGTTCWPRSPAGPRPIIARCSPAPTSRTATAPASTTAWSSSRPVSTSGSNTTTTPARACSISSTTTTRRWPPWPAGRRRRRGDFAAAVYEARIRRNPDRIQVQLIRDGTGLRRAGADHQGPDARRRQLHAGDRLLAGEPAAGPAAALRRRDELRRPARRRRRPLFPRRRRQPARASSARSSTWPRRRGCDLCDEWLGIDVGLKASRPTHFWTFPVETVSQPRAVSSWCISRSSCCRTGS